MYDPYEEIIEQAYEKLEKRQCPECGGSGMDEHTKIAIPDKPHSCCPTCHGTGHGAIDYV